MRRILPILLILAGCAANADDKARPTYTEALESFRSEVASVNATLGNQTAELEGVKEQLKAVDKRLGKIESLLSADTEISLSVPQADESPKSTTPAFDNPVNQAIARGEHPILFQGKPIDVNAWLSRKVAFVDIRGDIDAHLRDHGLEGDFSRFSRSQKLQLHSVAHSTGIPLKSSQKPPKVATVVQPFAATRPGNCPNCRLQTSYFWSRRR